MKINGVSYAGNFFSLNYVEKVDTVKTVFD